MKLIHVLYLAMLPLVFELGTEVYRTKVLHRNDKHIFTALIRLIIMLIGALTYIEVPWYDTLILMLCMHYLCFNYIFNKYALDSHWSYLGNNLWDRAQKHINPTVLLISKIALFLMAIIVILYH